MELLSRFENPASDEISFHLFWSFQLRESKTLTKPFTSWEPEKPLFDEFYVA